MKSIGLKYNAKFVQSQLQRDPGKLQYIQEYGKWSAWTGRIPNVENHEDKFYFFLECFRVKPVEAQAVTRSEESTAVIPKE